MNVLGINYFFHDTSACVIRGGALVAALEQERLSRRKHTDEFPGDAIEKCLAMADLSFEDVDCVAVSINPTKHLFRKFAYGITLGLSAGPFFKHEVVRAYLRQRSFWRWYRSFFREGYRPPVHFVDHHLAHIVGSYLVSPYSHAALLSLDGAGEWSTCWMGEASDRDFTCLGESYFPNSLGSFYESVTEFCGFRPNYDEGKTMGLAPFGDPSAFFDQVDRLVSVRADGSIRVDPDVFAYQNSGSRRCGENFYRAFGAPRERNATIETRHKNAAAAFQAVLEVKVLEICEMLRRRTEAEFLVVAGGVALNSVMNGRIVRETGFKDLYVMPAAGDSGTAIGAAYYAYNVIMDAPDRHFHDSPYLGTEYSRNEIRKTLEDCKISFREADDVCAETAHLLHAGKIIGWFQGRMEIGPRALGARSILADPTRNDVKARINAEVKHREAYRPFAPSVTVENRREYFEIEVEAPFMLKVCKVKESKRGILPGTTHVDGTARVQTVRRESNEKYHRLLTEFGRLSGVPVLLNTSFNVMGEPIVESPLDAIRCFFSTGLDSLVIGDYILEK